MTAAWIRLGSLVHSVKSNSDVMEGRDTNEIHPQAIRALTS